MATVQRIFAQSQDNPALTGATEYAAVMGMGDTTWKDEASVETICPANGIFTNFRVAVGAIPGTGKTWTFHLRINNADALTCTISDAATIGAIDITQAAVTAGQRVSISATATTSTSNPTSVFWACDFIPATSGDVIFMGSNNGGAGLNGYYVALNGCATSQNVAYQSSPIVPLAGTVKNLYMEVNAAPGGVTSRTLTVVDGSLGSTALAATITGAATTGSDTSDSFSHTAGDTLAVLHTVSGSPAASNGIKFGFVISASTPGQFCSVWASDAVVSGAANRYLSINGIYAAPVLPASEVPSALTLINQATTLKSIWVDMFASPGASPKAFTFSARTGTNAARTMTDTADSFTIDATNYNTVGNTTASDVSLSVADVIDIECAPVSSPTGTRQRVSLLFYVAPTGVNQLLQLMGVGT